MTTTSTNGHPGPRTVRDAFRLYLDCGLNPLPGRPKSKATVFDGDDVYQRKARIEYLDEWFPLDQELNIGVVNGKLSNNLADVDLDSPEAVCLAPALLPPTAWRFGRQGAADSLHHEYSTDSHFPKATRKFIDPVLPPGDARATLLELRGSGHWSIWPPSVHPGGQPIVWRSIDDRGPTRVTLIVLERAVGRLAAASILSRYWPVKGCRDDCALALAGALVRQGWDVGATDEFVGAVALAAEDDEPAMRTNGKAERTARKLEAGEHVWGWPKLAQLLGDCGGKVVAAARTWLGLTTTEGAATAAAKPTRKKVVSLPPFRPFPTCSLPPVLRDYVEASAEAIGCDPALVSLPALATAAGAIGNSRALCLRKGWVEPACLWALTVADSGGHKSPAYAAATAPLLDLQMDLFDAHRQAVEEYDARTLGWKDTPKGERGEKPEPPEDPEVFVTGDTTIEALGEVLRDNARGVLVSRDELDGWFQGFTRYKGKGGGSDRAQWLELHRAGILLVERLTRERGRLAVRRALVSVAGTIQPGTLAKALDADALQAGLGARFLMAMPPRRRRVWTEAEVADDLAERYQGLLRSLLGLELADREKRKPHVLGLSGPAKALWVSFFNEWGEVQHAAEGEQAACFAKIEAYGARLMLLHHVVAMAAADVSDCRAVTEASARAGIELTRWFAYEATRIYSILRESEEQRGARTLVEWVRSRGGHCTVRELQNSNSRKWPSREEAEAALQALVDAGVGEWVEGAAPGGGHRVRTFVLRVPTSDTSDTRPDGDDGPDDPASDTRSATRPPGGGGRPGFPDATSYRERSCGATDSTGHGRVSEVSDLGCDVGEERKGSSPGGECRTPADRVSGAYLLVDRAEMLPSVLVAIDEADLVALDTETTGLDPRADRVRLLSLGLPTNGGTTFAYVLDAFAIDLAPVLSALAGKAVVAHNACFDLGFLARLGFGPSGKFYCTMTRSRLLYAGERMRHGLKDCLERELGVQAAKEMQKADWTGPLTDAHSSYAARDVLHLPDLLAKLDEKLAAAGMTDVVGIEDRALPAVAWMGSQGVAVDRYAWLALVEKAEQDAARLKSEMAGLAPIRPGEMFASWHYDSAKDTKAMFHALGFPVEGTGDETLAGIDHPIAGMLRAYRAATKKTGNYGREWLKHVSPDGRVYPTWNQTGSEAGRMSASAPNVQQIPRERGYRNCVFAPVGRVLLKADYSQIELRVAARVSGDESLLDAYRAGIDVHRQTAQRVLGKEDVTKEDRQLAKAINFGLIYGMSAGGFRRHAKGEYGLDLTEHQAAGFRDAFFRAYPGLVAWHRKVRKAHAPETRTLIGRRRLIPSADLSKPRDERRKFEAAMDRQRLNTPIQGCGADGLKLALALLWERRDQAPDAFPVLAVHDEIVVEADEDQADAAAEWLKAAMVDAMAPLIDPVPVEVEVKVGRTWGGG